MMETTPKNKKEQIVFNLSKIIQSKLAWLECPYITRAWCTYIAFGLVNYLEQQGISFENN